MLHAVTITVMSTVGFIVVFDIVTRLSPRFYKYRFYDDFLKSRAQNENEGYVFVGDDHDFATIRSRRSTQNRRSVFDAAGSGAVMLTPF